MYNANLQVKYVKSNVESKNLIAKCSILNAKTWKYNPLNLNVKLNIAYERVNVQGKNLNVARGKLNDGSVNSDVKQQMLDKKRKVQCCTRKVKEAQNSNISVRSLGSNGPFNAGNHAITRGFVR